jgi:hypothetical protein
MLGQALRGQPTEDRIGVGGIRERVPALVARVRYPDGYDRIAEAVDQDRLKPAARMAMLRRADRALPRRPTDAEAPPWRVGWAAEKAQPEILVSTVGVRRQ